MRDGTLIEALRSALDAEGALLELVAPEIGGIVTSDGTLVVADHKVGGAPSVVFDAVAVLPSAEGTSALLSAPAARDFVADAFAHCKHIGYVEAVQPLLDAAGVAEQMDDGFVALDRERRRGLRRAMSDASVLGPRAPAHLVTKRASSDALAPAFF